MYRVIAAAVLAAALLGASASPTAAERAAAKHAFVPLLARLAKSAVPVLLPGSLPGPDLINAIPQVESANADGYAIELGLAPDCTGATACHIGHISGTKSGGSALKGEKVALPIGVTGYYVNATCGASCGDSTITFDRGGYRYEFAEKGASKGDLREFAATIVTPAQLKSE
jgi:hypothetical protein